MDHKGYLLVMMQPPPALEEEFNAWYDTEHLPERLSVKGFETALRYICISGFPKYLALYDLQSAKVLESNDYLKVSFDNSSPWTKRVTSRVKVERCAGTQIYPGNQITSTASRLLLLRFSSLTEKASEQIIHGMHENYGGAPETIQIRILENKTPKGIDYFGLVELRAPIAEKINLEKFGNLANSLDLINIYAKY